MFRQAFRAGRKCDEIGCLDPLQGDHPGDPWLSGRQGAGLVQTDHIDATGSLKATAPADEDPLSGRPGDGRHDCRRRREGQGARARDDQHRHCREEVAGCKVNRKGKDQDGWGEPLGPCVRDPDDRGAIGLGVAHKRRDAPEGRRLADTCNPDIQRTTGRKRAGMHRIADGAGGGNELPGDPGFVDQCLPSHNGAVGRQAFARSDHHDVASHKRIDRDDCLAMPVTARRD